MKKSVFKALLPTLAMILVAVMALTGTTYAWFTNVTEASVDSLDIKVTSAANLKLAVMKSGGASGWTNSLGWTDINNSTDAVVPSDLENFAAVSTNGVVSSATKLLEFYTAEVDTVNDGKIKNIEATNGDFYKFDVYIWNDSPDSKTITLSGSIIKDVADTDAGKEDKDATAAMRVAIINQGEAAYTQGDTLAAITNAGSSATIWEVNTASVVTASDRKTYGLKAPYASSIDYNSTTVAQEVTGMKTTASDLSVTISASSVAKVTVYIWLEGQDVDCVNAITKGDITIDLKLAAN